MFNRHSISKFDVNFFGLYGFTFISDETNQIKTDFFHTLSRVQQPNKTLLICPTDLITPINFDEYKEHAKYEKIINKPIQNVEEITDYVKKGYSIFIYNLKKCLETGILTDEIYTEYIKITSKYFLEHYNIHRVSLFFKHYIGLSPKLRYVTDITGLDNKKYSASLPRHLISKQIDKNLAETDRKYSLFKIKDPCNEFYFYDDEAGMKLNKEFLTNLYELSIKLTLTEQLNENTEPT